LAGAGFLASAVGRDLPFSPTSLGAARVVDRTSMPGYSGDRGPQRDNQNTAAYGDWGDGRSGDIGGRREYRGGSADPDAGYRSLNPIQNRREYERRSQVAPGGLLGHQVPVGRVSSARFPGQYGTIPVGSETNALDVLGEEGSFRSFPSRPRLDPNAGNRGLNPIQNRREYERRSQVAPVRIPGGLLGPVSTRFADSTGGLAPNAGFGVPAGMDLSSLVTGSRPAGRGRRPAKQDRLGRLPDLPVGVMSRMGAAASRARVGGLMAGWFADQEPPAARDYGLSPSARISAMPEMPVGFDQRYGLPDLGTAALQSNPNYRPGAAPAASGATRAGGLLGKTVDRPGLSARRHPQQVRQAAPPGVSPPAPRPTELDVLWATQLPAALRNPTVGGLLGSVPGTATGFAGGLPGPYFAALARAGQFPSMSSVRKKSDKDRYRRAGL